MNGSNFESANLQDISFNSSELTGLRLASATLAGVQLVGAKITSCDIRGAVISNTSFASAQVTKTDFTNAKMVGADLSYFKCEGCTFVGVDLHDGNLEFAVLNGMDFSAADLANAKLDSAQFSQTLFGKARLKGASLIKADLRKADLQNADLRQANLREARIQGANFNGALFNLQTQLPFSKDEAIRQGMVLKGYGEPLLDLNGFSFYKVQATGLMLDANILSTCEREGFKPPCTNSNSGDFSDSKCLDVGFRDGSLPMHSISKVICDGNTPDACALLEGVFTYMGEKYRGGCGVVDSGWCTDGDNYENGIALCAEKI